MLGGRQWVLDDILDVQVRPDLVEIWPQVVHLGVGEHDELHAGGRLVVVELVFAGAVGEEGVVVAAELGDEVAQGEDEAKHQLLVVGIGEGLARGGAIPTARDARGGLRARRLARGGGTGCPAARIDALRWLMCGQRRAGRWARYTATVPTYYGDQRCRSCRAPWR